MKKTKLILSSLAIASFLVGPAINLPTASAQTNEDDYQKQLYDNKELFEQLSGAAQSALELKFGQVVAPASRPAPGGPTTDFLTAIEEDSNILVNNPNEDLTARDTQSETTLVVFGPGGIDNTSCSAFNDSGSFVPPATASSKFTGFSQSINGGETWTDQGTLPTNANGDAGDPVLARSGGTGKIFLSTLP